MSWTCAVCRRPFNERPAHEAQHLFTCGSVCGYLTRVCRACLPVGDAEAVKVILADIAQLDHREHHRKVPVVKKDLAYISKPMVKR